MLKGRGGSTATPTARDCGEPGLGGGSTRELGGHFNFSLAPTVFMSLRYYSSRVVGRCCPFDWPPAPSIRGGGPHGERAASTPQHPLRRFMSLPFDSSRVVGGCCPFDWPPTPSIRGGGPHGERAASTP